MTETSVDASLSVLRALAVAAAPYLPVTEASARGEIERAIRRMREQVLPQQRQASWMMLLFAYRDLSDAELAQYVEFAESPTGQWYFATTGRSFVDAVSVVVRAAAVELAQFVPPSRWHQTPQREAPAATKRASF
jgi:hypothetical protein